MLDTFVEMVTWGHEQVVFCNDPETHLRGIIAVHSTVLGPALGGTRCWTYDSTEAALYDVLRLSRGMTYKASVAGMDLGGGKAVMIKDAASPPTAETFEKYGEFIESLGGKYVTAEDVGTDEAAMNAIRRATRHVTGGVYEGGYGDPSPITAIGVFEGIKAAAESAFGSDNLAGKTVAVQGCGHVGSYICKLLHEAGAKLVVADIDAKRVQKIVEATGAATTDVKKVLTTQCDILCPAALGGVLGDKSIPALKCRVVAGAANNQLVEEQRHARALQDRGVLYIPDYAINSGGLIHVGSEYLGIPKDEALARAHRIGDTIRRIIATASEHGITTLEAANKMAEDRIADATRAAV
ncbi:MAG: Leucine dehydrogenase [Phycisphaerae bacterium]|nr:Leucine dehydrogenase [Phycisphaerae bacterium]